jgi:hypothetical protein
VTTSFRACLTGQYLSVTSDGIVGCDPVEALWTLLTHSRGILLRSRYGHYLCGDLLAHPTRFEVWVTETVPEGIVLATHDGQYLAARHDGRVALHGAKTPASVWEVRAW